MELLITVTIVSIVIGLAAPNFSALVKTNALTSQSNYFTSAIQLARSEAIKRNARVVICKRAGRSCTTAGEWEDGWIVYADTDADQNVDIGEEIRVFDKLPDGYTLTDDATNLNSVAFNADGMATAATGGVFTGAEFSLCDPSGDETIARNISMNLAGRIRLAEGVDACR